MEVPELSNPNTLHRLTEGYDATLTFHMGSRSTQWAVSKQYERTAMAFRYSPALNTEIFIYVDVICR